MGPNSIGQSGASLATAGLLERGVVRCFEDFCSHGDHERLDREAMRLLAQYRAWLQRTHSPSDVEAFDFAARDFSPSGVVSTHSADRQDQEAHLLVALRPLLERD